MTSKPVTIGTKLQQARKDAGMTLDDVLVRIRTDLPEVMWISRTTLNRFEKASEVEPWIVRYLASVYGVSVGSFADAEATERDRIFMDLMTRDLGLDGTQRFRRYTCGPVHVAVA
jgi:transcriptional regulator with XRE-family HTH domain